MTDINDNFHSRIELLTKAITIMTNDTIDEKDKLNETKLKEKKDILGKIIDIYGSDEPINDTEKKKRRYVKKKNVESNQESVKQHVYEIVLEQFKLNGKTYYKDSCNGIIDGNTCQLVGSVVKINENGEYVCEFFSDKYEIDKVYKI